jgi:hypothetical protein
MLVVVAVVKQPPPAVILREELEVVERVAKLPERELRE